MSNEVYPVLPGLGFGTERTISFATTVQENVSGKEVRQSLRANSVLGWKLKYEFVRQRTGKTELLNLFGFFRRHRGAGDDFLFNDIWDNAVTDQLLGVGNGSNRVFQLVRTWDGFTEPVQSPNVITNMKVNGTITAAYTLGANGLITFTAAPPAGQNVTWTGTYYWRARFLKDDLTVREFVRGFFDNQGIDLKHVPQ